MHLFLLQINLPQLTNDDMKCAVDGQLNPEP